MGDFVAKVDTVQLVLDHYSKMKKKKNLHVIT